MVKCYEYKILPTNVYSCNDLINKIEYNLEFRHINNTYTIINDILLKNKMSNKKYKKLDIFVLIFKLIK